MAGRHACHRPQKHTLKPPERLAAGAARSRASCRLGLDVSAAPGAYFRALAPRGLVNSATRPITHAAGAEGEALRLSTSAEMRWPLTAPPPPPLSPHLAAARAVALAAAVALMGTLLALSGLPGLPSGPALIHREVRPFSGAYPTAARHPRPREGVHFEAGACALPACPVCMRACARACERVQQQQPPPSAPRRRRRGQSSSPRHRTVPNRRVVL